MWNKAYILNDSDSSTTLTIETSGIALSLKEAVVYSGSPRLFMQQLLRELLGAM